MLEPGLHSYVRKIPQTVKPAPKEPSELTEMETAWNLHRGDSSQIFRAINLHTPPNQKLTALLNFYGYLVYAAITLNGLSIYATVHNRA